MSQANDSDSVRPADRLEEDLQRELDEALGDMSIEDLLAAESEPRRPRASTGGLKAGRVLSIQGDDIFIDLGGKSQGVLSAAQFVDKPLPAEGDIVEVAIKGYDRADGLLLLSLEGAATEADWSTLEEGQILNGRVTDHNKGGLELLINGIRAFMPISQIEMYRVEDLAPYVNQKLECEVIEFSRADEKLVVSRRNILERQAAEAKKEAFQKLAEGAVLKGVVKTIMPYGAFVDIGGVDGLLHVKDMAYSRVENPEAIVKVGQTVEIKVLKIDREARKISLGLKQVQPDPWTGAETKWNAGDVVSGRVTRLADFGAFVELEPGIEGLLPISELTFEKRVKHPSEVVREGDVARVKVLSVDPVQRRISLSLKRAGDDPWTGAAARWPESRIVEGRVVRVTDFGAFVELSPGVQGLVHISELSLARVRTVGEVVREGDRVQVKVLSVDEGSRRISLSIKQAAISSIASMEGQPAAPRSTRESAAGEAEPRKRKKPLKGGLE